MGKKPGKRRAPGNPETRARLKAEETHRARSRANRRIIVSVAIVAVLIVGVVVGISAYNSGADTLRDLSVVGRGVPAVVHVHDHTCPVCAQLRTNVSRIESDFPDSELLIRVADLQTPEGRAFAQSYGAGFRTLLFFDGAGNLVAAQTGVQESNVLRETFRLHAAGRL